MENLPISPPESPTIDENVSILCMRVDTKVQGNFLFPCCRRKPVNDQLARHSVFTNYIGDFFVCMAMGPRHKRLFMIA